MTVGMTSQLSQGYITEMITDFIQECIRNIMYKSCMPQCDDQECNYTTTHYPPIELGNVARCPPHRNQSSDHISLVPRSFILVALSLHRSFSFGTVKVRSSSDSLADCCKDKMDRTDSIGFHRKSQHCHSSVIAQYQ